MKVSWIPIAVSIVPIASALALGYQTAASREPARVAFVSSQRILSESSDARAELTRFRAAQQQRANDLRAKQQALEATRLKIAQANDETTRQSLRQQEQQQRADLERAAAQAQADQQAEQRQLVADLQVRIKPVMEEIAKSRDLDVVLNSDTAIIWGSARVDLTNEVLKRLKGQPPSTPPEKR
jgi:Skp family chaperone for outer membrane proteins